ncbi:MAG TPA: SpoIIE family protein phosphatase [Salinivirgaceae bacterium]|nr:SpoIIE family protein phosphatase [Salinivirgaceae bacterium]
MGKYVKKIVILTLVFLSVNSVIGQVLKDISPERKAQFDQLMNMADNAKTAGDLKGRALNLAKAAFIVWESNRLFDAVDLFQEAADLLKKVGDYPNLRSVYTNLGVLYSDMQDIDKARNYFDLSLEISRTLGQNEQIASGIIDIAYILAALGKYDESNGKLTEALQIATMLNNQKLLLNIYGLMASNYRLMGDKNKASEYENKYNALYTKTQEDLVKRDYEQREVKSLAEISRTREQQRLQELELNLKKLMLQSAQDSLSIAMEETRQKQLRIQLLEQENELRQAKLIAQELKQREADALLKHQQAMQQQQRIILIFTVTLLIVFLIFGIFLYRRNVERRRINQQLELQNKEILEKSEELATALTKIEKQNNQIMQSINYAKGIQQAMVPPPESLKAFFPESFVFWQPRDVVSGDFYWFKPIDSKFDLKKIFHYERTIISRNDNYEKIRETDRLLIAAVDCTGHGVPGAFMSMIANNILEEITNKGISRPEMILEQLHFGVQTALKQNVTGNKDGMDIALCLVDKKSKKLVYAGANNPLIYIKNGEIFHIKGTAAPIGGAQNTISNYETHEIPLDEPAVFYIFSDGFVDQFGGPDGRKFMIKKFRELLFEIHQLPFSEQENLLRVTFEGWKGDRYQQIDDVLVIGFKIDFNENAQEHLEEQSIIPQQNQIF